MDIWLSCILLPWRIKRIKKRIASLARTVGTVCVIVYILAVGNAAIGFLEKLTFLESSGIAKYGSEAYLVNFTAIVTIFYGAFVIFTVFARPPQEDDYSYSAI